MIIHELQVGMIGTNCYLVASQETKEAMVIDPGDEADRIFQLAEKHGYKITIILNTHGHWDHIGGNKTLKELTQAPILIHESDDAYLTDSKLNLGSLFGNQGESPKADRLLREGDIVTVGNLTFKVLHTPGHTPGGISLVGDKVVFVGDTLFKGSIGRTDFTGGSFSILISSIKNKLITLDDDLLVYPGHGPHTTIGQEKKENPFLV
ncbi:MAG: MBL fold metallo-hydrolase [Dehalobacterium sp.]|jgi:hydroxyacylglutathione hydrolase